MADLVSYLVFDVEAVADGALIAQAKFGDEELSPGEAIARFGAERLEQYGSNVLPPAWMLPISVAVAKVDSGFRLLGLEVLDFSPLPDISLYLPIPLYISVITSFRCSTSLRC